MIFPFRVCDAMCPSCNNTLPYVTLSFLAKTKLSLDCARYAFLLGLSDWDPKPMRALSTACMGAKSNRIPCQINCLTVLFHLLSHNSEQTSDACRETWHMKLGMRG